MAGLKRPVKVAEKSSAFRAFTTKDGLIWEVIKNRLERSLARARAVHKLKTDDDQGHKHFRATEFSSRSRCSSVESFGPSDMGPVHVDPRTVEGFLDSTPAVTVKPADHSLCRVAQP